MGAAHWRASEPDLSSIDKGHLLYQTLGRLGSSRTHENGTHHPVTDRFTLAQRKLDCEVASIGENRTTVSPRVADRVTYERERIEY